MDDLNELIQEFLVESGENLDRLDQDFLALEKDPTATEQLKSIFRTIHTIKGTCGFFGFHKLESITHVGESLLGRLQAGDIPVSVEIITCLLKMVDVIRTVLREVEASGNEGNGDYSALVAELTLLKDGEVTMGTYTSAVDAEVKRSITDSQPEPELELPPVDFAAMWVGEDLPGMPAKAAVETPAPMPVAHGKPAVILINEPKKEVPVVAAAPAAESSDSHGSAAANAGIRVDVGLLDRLMNLVGELVLARNQILQYAGTQENPILVGPTQRLNLITTELQEGVMKTRMQPIGNVFNKFPRIVRDLANICGKQVRVEMEGRETELDKTIIEAIKDPLTHIIRNSVDHGIERAEQRVNAGKPAEGCLSLEAFHEGGQVNIEIRDDGGGINIERVKAKAIEKSILTAEAAARMTDREAINLIFAPGFSTAEKVTNVSGRGVGMDVVKTNIEKIGGTVDIQSKLGSGTTLRIKIPLTLAIIPALIISSGAQRYAIPQVSLLELVRLEPDQVRTGVEMIHGTPVYRLRGNLLPLVYLNKELKSGSYDQRDRACNIVVVQADGTPFGLIVDDINDTEEIVVKPLGKQLKGLSTFAGATIMGDGRVALILDVMGLAQRANVVGAQREALHEAMENAGMLTKQVVGDVQTLLLFQVAPGRRMAAPLSSVARLEEFSRSMLESAGDVDCVQYRKQIMPLVHLSSIIAERPQRQRRLKPSDTGISAVLTAPSDTIQVIVYSDADQPGRTIGLVVESIVDIVEAAIDLQPKTHRPGVLGSAIIQDKVTEILDVEHVVGLAADVFVASAEYELNAAA